MKGRFHCLLIALQMVSWVSATSRPFPPNYSLVAHQPGREQTSGSLAATLDAVEGVKIVRRKTNPEAMHIGVSRIGSSPPNCHQKCYGCVPCEAAQVPTTSRHSPVGIQYANYEPEGWKCKCGPSFYSP